MKYIRTKDGKIFLIHEDLETKDLWYFENREKIITISCNPSDLGKVADTIEDLCDKFVWFNAPHYYEIYDDFEDIEDCYHAENVTTIYGAIWTNKGLVFVAQLKERKLELL